MAIHAIGHFAKIGDAIAQIGVVTCGGARLAFVFLAHAIDAGFTGRARRVFDAHTIDAGFIGFAVVWNACTALFVRAFGALWLLLTTAIERDQASAACADRGARAASAHG